MAMHSKYQRYENLDFVKDTKLLITPENVI